MKYILLILTLFTHMEVKAGECQKITVDDKSSDYKVYASATKGLHIRFFDEIKFAILSNDVLWKTSTNKNMKNHFWLYSKNFSVQDNEVGITFITNSNRSINLVVQQNIDSSSCLIVDDSGLNHAVVADFTSDEGLEQQKLEPLITSSYMFDKSMVRAAHDNSRFTMVELNGFSTGKSLYSVVAINDGLKHTISDPKFDSITNTYKIPGIHDELLFEKGTSKFKVTRQ